MCEVLCYKVVQRKDCMGSFNIENSVELLSHDVTKIQTNELPIHVCAYFREVFQHLNILVDTNVLFESVLRFAIFPGFCVTRHLTGGRESSYVG